MSQQFRIVFEYETEDTAMSDVLLFTDRRQAQEKFDELRGQLILAIDPTQCQVTDDPDLYGVVDHDNEAYGFVRLDVLNE
ncbi:MAG: hypothetical protein IJ632_01780 [Muribaculaceae bacterium]|nr:hypothetical protein [Muribaculaceae bacterium]